VPRQVYLFDRPTRFVAGTVGQPGDRTFYLQASDAAGRTVSVADVEIRDASGTLVAVGRGVYASPKDPSGSQGGSS